MKKVVKKLAVLTIEMRRRVSQRRKLNKVEDLLQTRDVGKVQMRRFQILRKMNTSRTMIHQENGTSTALYVRTEAM